MNNPNEKTLTKEQQKYFEEVTKLPPEEQAKAASFAAGLLAASKLNKHPAA